MRKLISLIIISIVLQTVVVAQSIHIIPQPQHVKISQGDFILDNETPIVCGENSRQNALYLQAMLAPGMKLDIMQKGNKGIVLRINNNLSTELGEEGYNLSIDKKSILISAPTQTGIFHGIQSLLQLLPADLYAMPKKIPLQAMAISDYPRFQWRAFMLDDSRHFKGMKEVKKLLDEMAALKMNVFHWHLTDDQGWRVEIKKYPKLTEVGAFRKNSQIGGWNSEERSGESHGGFYSQDQIREIVNYAKERYISIVPEIEMPGHASAAIAAYPWLGTIGELTEVPVVFGKLPDSYKVSDPRVYQFIEDVLTEIMSLFPGGTIHIGGDEVKFDAWKESKEIQTFMKENGLKSPADLQVYFTNRVSNFIDKNSNRMMGWNEILGSNIHEWQSDEDFQGKETLAKSAIIHFWKGNLELLTEAVSNGYDVVNSHHVSTYLDYSYEYIPLKKAYEFNPIPDGLDKQYHHKVLGSGCQMWGEWIPTVADMDKMVFPRLAAYAEVGWTSSDRKDYDVFSKNLEYFRIKWKGNGIKIDHFEKDPTSVLTNGLVEIRINGQKGTYDIIDIKNDRLIVSQSTTGYTFKPYIDLQNLSRIAIETTIPETSYSSISAKNTIKKSGDITTAFTGGNSLSLVSRTEGYGELETQFTIYPDSSFVEIGFSFKNLSDKPVRLNRIELVNGLFLEGLERGNMMTLDGNSGAGKTDVSKTGQTETENNVLCYFADPDQISSLVAGGLEYEDYRKWVNVSGNRMIMYAKDVVGKRVDPGNNYISGDSFYLNGLIDNPYDALESYADLCKKARDININYYTFPSVCMWFLSVTHFGADATSENSTVGAVKEMENISESGFLKYSPVAMESAYREAVAASNFMGMRQATTLGSLPGTSAKLDRLAELLEDHRESGRKVIIFSYFLKVLAAVEKRFGALGVVSGKVPVDERQRMVDDLAATDGHALLLLQIAAGGQGLNIQSASAVVLMEPQTKPSSEAQAIARSHRMGQTNRVIVHRLLARDTCDEALVRILAEKQQLFDAYAKQSLVKEASRQATERSLAKAVVEAEQQRLAEEAPADAATATAPTDVATAPAPADDAAAPTDDGTA